MSDTSKPEPTTLSVPMGALLSLRDGPDKAEWGRIRSAQLGAARRLALPMATINALGAIAVALVIRRFMPVWEYAGWTLVVLTLAGVITAKRMRSRHRGEGYATIEEVRETIRSGIGLALIWAVVPLILAHGLPDATLAGLGMVVAVLMTAVAVALAPLALATLVFLALLGSAVVAALAIDHRYAAAGGFVVFTALLAAACLLRARALVTIRISQIALDEARETVSLLLRECEDHGSDWLWETDAQRRIVKASPRFAFACGLDPVTIEGMAFVQVLAGPTWESGDCAAGLRTLADHLTAREAFRALRLPVCVGGVERWWELTASPRYDEEGTFAGFRGVGSDVTEQRASADQIARLARIDTLTQLPNRLSVNETLGRAMQDSERWGRRSAFMMIDLDRFKAVNDSLGHPIGDRLLGRVAERLGQLMGDQATCGRLGGDEFAVVVADATDAQAVEALAHRIIETISRPYEVDNHTLYIGASVGLAISPRDGRTPETLIRSADLALYRSKDAGGGVFHAYEPQLHAQAEERRLIEIALRQALQKGEMHLAYQPVVDAGTGRLTGFEALLRWQSPQFGSVSPVKFIPIAEEMRLIAPIGAWVMRTACEEAARWPSHIRVAVNVSPDQLQNPDFVTTVTTALANSGLSAERLELEVTESVFMHEGIGATRILERVLDMGVRLSLDDFGTGYSSLGYLSRTRFSTIKIDRSFVTAAAKGVREAIAIIRAVVALADSLGMATTAEGVETEDEHRMVQQFGCTKVQGYYFGRPLPVEDARAVADRSRDRAAA